MHSEGKTPKHWKNTVKQRDEHGRITSVLTEGPMGSKLEKFDADGQLTECRVAASDGKWKHEFFKNGRKTTVVTFDGKTRSTIVLDEKGHVSAAEDDE